MFRLLAVEKIILFLVLAILAAGYILFYTDLPKFEAYVREDGIVEWMTVLGLLLGCITCIGRFIMLR